MEAVTLIGRQEVGIGNLGMEAMVSIGGQHGETLTGETTTTTTFPITAGGDLTVDTEMGDMEEVVVTTIKLTLTRRTGGVRSTDGSGHSRQV